MGEGGSWLVEGIGEDFIPVIADFSQVAKAYAISDAESFAAARELLRREGVLAGSSSGTLLAAALKYCREQTEAKTVVSFACDTGNKYLSKLFNDFWMEDEGFITREPTGDLLSELVHTEIGGERLTEEEKASRIRSYNPYWTHVISYHEWLGHTVQRAYAEGSVTRPIRGPRTGFSPRRCSL